MKRKTIVLFLLVALVAGCAANSYGIQATGVTGYGRDCKKIIRRETMLAYLLIFAVGALGGKNQFQVR